MEVVQRSLELESMAACNLSACREQGGSTAVAQLLHILKVLVSIG